jgi:hypothetical protein
MPAEEIANWMLAKVRFCMGAKAGSQAGLQTYDMFTSTGFANYDKFASGLTRIARLAKHMMCEQAHGWQSLFNQLQHCY